MSREFGGWRGVLLAFYFVACFAVLITLLAQSAALDLSDGLTELLDFWLSTDPIVAGVAALVLLILLPGIIYGLSIELVEVLGNLTWRVLRRRGWTPHSLDFWSHDSWTWMHLASSRDKKPLTPVEASCWWLCKHEDGPRVAPRRAAQALDLTPRDVRNALDRADRKFEGPEKRKETDKERIQAELMLRP